VIGPSCEYAEFASIVSVTEEVKVPAKANPGIVTNISAVSSVTLVVVRHVIVGESPKDCWAMPDRRTQTIRADEALLRTSGTETRNARLRYEYRRLQNGLQPHRASSVPITKTGEAPC
jgi:hypothetical protein